MQKSSQTGPEEAIYEDARIGERSRNALVSLTGTQGDYRLVREAGTYVAGTSGRLVLLSVLSPRAFADRQRARSRIRDLPPYTHDQTAEAHRIAAAKTGRDALSTLDIEYTAVGTIGHEVDRILVVAEAYDCGHLFLAARPRSGLRRFIEPDRAYSIADRFDGLVTVLRDDCEREESFTPPTPSTI